MNSEKFGQNSSNNSLNRPFNFKVLKKEFEFQSLDLLIELNDKNSEARTFRYKVDRLPTEINVGKTKLKVIFFCFLSIVLYLIFLYLK